MNYKVEKREEFNVRDEIEKGGKPAKGQKIRTPPLATETRINGGQKRAGAEEYKSGSGKKMMREDIYKLIAMDK